MKNINHYKEIVLEELRKHELLDESDLDLAMSYILVSIFADLEKNFPKLVKDLSEKEIKSEDFDLEKSIPFFDMSFNFYLSEFLDDES